tara:strand:- start:227 stop:799 length:573 start_codon:yes stop_codon:yes gene_type:complete
MNNQILFIYDSRPLFDIFNELKDTLSFNVVFLSKKEIEHDNIHHSQNFLIISVKRDLNLPNIIKIEKFPINFFKLLEKININFLKQKFSKQSNINIGKYNLNTNSRNIILNNVKLKLTEKEINTIIYLLEKKTPVKIGELQEKVWGYNFKLETHTVETHIHRLRKKIKEKFLDSELIVSNKNGYQIFKKK